MKNLLTAAALFVVAASPAFAAAPAQQHSFTRDGQTYIYTAVDKTDHVVLAGRRFPSGDTFDLVVRGDRVSGFSGGVPVAFSAPDAQQNVKKIVIASR